MEAQERRREWRVWKMQYFSKLWKIVDFGEKNKKISII